jgi:putative ABC transport system permease protein
MDFMMRWIYKLPLRVRSLFRKKRVEQELSDELRFHLEKLIEENVAKGMSAEEARYAALREFGGIEQLKEECRDSWGVRLASEIGQDVRHGLRQLRRNPGFAAVAVLTLALGIGANTAIFTVVDAVLLQPLPYKDPQRLVLVRERIPRILPDPVALPAPDVVTFERESHVFSAITAFQNQQHDLTGGGTPERINVARVTASLFPLLGVHPLLGRLFTPQEDEPDQRVVLLSYNLWQERFGGDKQIVGKTVSLDRKSHVIVGVMPPGFSFPLPGMSGSEPAALWVPMGFTPAELRDVGDNFDYTTIARLKPGVTLAEANADISATAHGIQATVYTGLSGFTLEATASPLKDVIIQRVRPLIAILMGAVTLVLLIACINVAGLLFVRAADREQEMAIRLAMGASRFRVVRGLLTESLLLGITGGACGLFVSVWGLKLLVSLAPIALLHIRPLRLNGQALVFAVMISAGTGLIFGLLPALGLSRGNLSHPLREGRRATGGAVRQQTRSVMVIGEIALSLMLLAGAGLLIRSFEKMHDTDPGFAPQRVLTATVALDSTAYGNATLVRSFCQRLLERVASLPTVQAAGASTDLPLESNWNHLFTVEEHLRQPSGRSPMSDHTVVLGRYFQSLSVPLLRGRLFTPDDRAGTMPVVIVSEGLAKRYWAGEDPIGKRIKWGPPESKSPWMTVVGVVGNVKHRPLDTPTQPHTYQPLSQLNDSAVESIARVLHLTVQCKGNPAGLADVLRRQVQALDPAVPLTTVRTMDEVLASSISPRRFTTLLMSTFAAVALLLASIGLYGLIAYSVRQRTHEFGIRMALGAEKREVLRMVIGQGFRLALIGLAIGLVGAFTLTRFLTSQLYGVTPTDPLTFITVSLILIAVALLACYIPAQRAAKVDPMVALRYE